MLLLAGASFPGSSDELAVALRRPLEDILTLPPTSHVAATGGAFPAIEALTLELSGAAVTRVPPGPPKLSGGRTAGVTVGRFELRARPVRYQSSAVELAVTASDVAFDFARDEVGNAVLVLADARDGRVEAGVSKSDLRALLLSAATAAAKRQGVAIQEFDFDLDAAGPRSVEVRARVKAKKMMMSGVVHVRGRAAVDDQMIATLSDLACTGEGMVGTMAAGMLGAKLKELNGRAFPLAAYSLGEVAVRDVRIETGDGVRVVAEFGR